MYINKLHLAGRFTHTPSKYIKKLPSGTSVLNMTLAQNRTYKDSQGNKKDEPEFNEVVFFGKTAEIIAQYCDKGQEVYVEGRIRNETYEKKGVFNEDGSPLKITRTKVIVDNFQFGPKSGQKSGSEPSVQYGQENANEGNFEPMNMGPADISTEDINPNDIPF